MSTEDYAFLSDRYISGAISAEERRELQRLLDADPALLQQFPRDVQLSIRLAAMVRSTSAADALVARVESLVAGNHASTRLRLVQQVEERLEARGTAPAQGAGSALRLHQRRRQQTSRPRPALWLAFATGILVAVGLTLIRLPDTTARLTIAVATTIDGHPARAGDPLPAGSRLHVGVAGHAVLSLPTRAVLDLAAGDLHLVDQAGSRIALEAGRLIATVQHQEHGELLVSTPQGEIHVHGTRFAVSASSASTWLEVADGRVGFAAGARTVEVGAGELAIAGGGAPALLPHAPPLAWPDRRPIGVQHLASPTLITSDNPRGWYLDDTRSGTVPFAVRFAKRLERIGRELIADLGTARNGINAQAMVLWDLEGCADGSASDRGDPRALARLAPEMDAVADAFIARLRAAGLRIGVPLTPRAECADAQAAAQDISDAIDWCKRRWQASVFVVSTSAQTVQGAARALFLDRLRRAHPEVLIVVSPGSTADIVSAAPLMTVSVERFASWPLPGQGFAVIGMAASERAGEAYVSWLAAALRAGHIPQVYAWSGFKDYAVLRAAQAEAARTTSQPTIVPGR